MVMGKFHQQAVGPCFRCIAQIKAMLLSCSLFPLPTKGLTAAAGSFSSLVALLLARTMSGCFTSGCVSPIIISQAACSVWHNIIWHVWNNMSEQENKKRGTFWPWHRCFLPRDCQKPIFLQPSSSFLWLYESWFFHRALRLNKMGPGCSKCVYWLQ